jgi:hypothetical protein
VDHPCFLPSPSSASVSRSSLDPAKSSIANWRPTIGAGVAPDHTGKSKKKKQQVYSRDELPLWLLSLLSKARAQHMRLRPTTSGKELGSRRRRRTLVCLLVEHGGV